MSIIDPIVIGEWKSHPSIKWRIRFILIVIMVLPFSLIGNLGYLLEIVGDALACWALRKSSATIKRFTTSDK